MADDFVDIPFVTNESDLEDQATTALASKWDGYVSAEADPEVATFESISPIAANLARMASNMPMQALIAAAIKLWGMQIQTGTSAYTTVRLNFQDTEGPYPVDALAEIDIDGHPFVLTQDVVCDFGQSTVDALFASTERSAAANGLSGTVVDPVTLPTTVVGIQVLAPTSGGNDPQTEDDFANQISRDRRLVSRAVVSLLDHELAALDVQGVARAHAETTSALNVTVTLMGDDGLATSTAVKAAVNAVYSSARRLSSVVVTLVDADYTSVNVLWSAVAEPGYDQTVLSDRINAALADELSPLTHGLPQSGDPGSSPTTWIVDTKIYVNRIVQVIGGVKGVHRVISVLLSGDNTAQLGGSGLPLSTGGPITALPVVALVNPINHGYVVATVDPTGAHTQNWVVTADAAAGATSLAVTSQTPNYAYPSGSRVVGGTPGDYALLGATPVPTPGNIRGTVS